MKIVVDTNIVFSALLNSNSPISSLIFNLPKNFEIYSCLFLKYEIDKHWDKIIKISKENENTLQVYKNKLYSRINFIDEIVIPQSIWVESEIIVIKIDIDDIAFVALSSYLKASLWTGDKKLYLGLKKSNYIDVLNTAELFLY